MLLELVERGYDTGSMIAATQYAKKGWRTRPNKPALRICDGGDWGTPATCV